jgi:hypothetical protein
MCCLARTLALILLLLLTCLDNLAAAATPDRSDDAWAVDNDEYTLGPRQPRHTPAHDGTPAGAVPLHCVAPFSLRTLAWQPAETTLSGLHGHNLVYRLMSLRR